MFKAQGKEPALTGWVTWKHPHKLPSQGTCSSFILSVALKPHGLKELKLGEPRGEQVKYSRGLLCPSGAQWPWPPANKLPRMLPPSRAPAQPPRKGGCVISKRANGWGIQHFPLHDLPRFSAQAVGRRMPGGQAGPCSPPQPVLAGGLHELPAVKV